TGKVCNNTTFRNIYIQGQLARFICLNGLVKPINYNNLVLENITLENIPSSYNWIYANSADNNSSSIEITFKNVRYGNRFINASDFKTKGTTNFTFNNNGTKYTGYMNPSEQSNCSCSGGGSNELNDINDLTAVATSCSQVVLNWTDNSTGESGFRVRRKKSGDAVYTTLGDVAANADSYTDNSVAASTTYIYQVRALDNGTAVTTSNTPQVNVPICAPVDDFNDITDLTAVATACDKVVLNWTDNSNGESGYRVRRKISGASTFTTLGDVVANAETYTDNNVNDNTTYIYQVRALDNGVAVKASNNPQVTTPACASNVDMRIEAEDFTSQSGIETEATSDVGGGLNIGWINNNDWTEYSVNIPQAGTYSMTFRVAGKKTADIIVESNGAQVGSVNVTPSGGWQTWNTVGPISVDLPAGQQTIKLTFKNNTVTNPLINVNWFEIYTPGLKSIENETVTETLAHVNIYPNPSNGVFNVAFDSDEQATLEIMNLSGAIVQSIELENGLSTINASELSQGMYTVKISTGTSSVLQKLIIQ
ncbi:MAG: carbohydrate-binding protein, partial [Bacteroidales bacterium]|nr:carbohydrate-binding protein [Bacteroidales bacterium]